MLRVTRALLKHASLSPRDFSRKLEGYARQLPDHAAFTTYVKRYVALLSVPARIPGAPPQKLDALDELYVEDEAAFASLRASDGWQQIEAAEATLFVRDACTTILTPVESVPPRRADTHLCLTALTPAGGGYARVIDVWEGGRLGLVGALIRAPRNADLVIGRPIVSY